MAWAVSAMSGRCLPVASLARPDGGGRLEAVHLGHLHVHQHHVEALRGERIERLAAVADDGDGVARLLEQRAASAAG